MKKLSALFVAMTLIVATANLALASDTPKPADHKDHKEKKDEKKPAEKKDEKKKH